MSDFVIGIWGVRWQDFQKWKDRGVSLFLSNDPQPTQPVPTTAAAYYKAAFDIGCKAMLLPGPKPSVDAAQPGFGGFTRPDEPEGDIDPQVYLNGYYPLKGKGRVFGNFTHRVIHDVPRKDYEKFLAGCDIWGFDYHIRNRGLGLEEGFKIWEQVIDGMQSICGRSKPFWVSIETGPHLPGALSVTPEIFKALNLKAKDEGAAGAVWFCLDEHPFSWDVTSPETAVSMPVLAAELLAPPPPPLQPVSVKDSAGKEWMVAP